MILKEMIEKHAEQKNNLGYCVDKYLHKPCQSCAIRELCLVQYKDTFTNKDVELIVKEIQRRYENDKLEWDR